MKRIVILLLSIILFIPSIHSQERRFGIGGLAGLGYGLNLSYAISIDDSIHLRHELFSIIYSADWYNSYPQGTLWNYYDHQIYYSQSNFKLVSKGHDCFGIGFGYRIMKKQIGYGVCFDILYKRHWDNYNSPYLGDIHTPIQRKQFIGLSGILTAAINDKCRTNLLIGSNIYMMVGIEWLLY
jgi:hypothetical protein